MCSKWQLRLGAKKKREKKKKHIVNGRYDLQGRDVEIVPSMAGRRKLWTLGLKQRDLERATDLLDSAEGMPPPPPGQPARQGKAWQGMAWHSMACFFLFGSSRTWLRTCQVSKSFTSCKRLHGYRVECSVLCMVRRPRSYETCRIVVSRQEWERVGSFGSCCHSRWTSV